VCGKRLGGSHQEKDAKEGGKQQQLKKGRACRGGIDAFQGAKKRKQPGGKVDVHSCEISWNMKGDDGADRKGNGKIRAWGRWRRVFGGQPWFERRGKRMDSRDRLDALGTRGVRWEVERESPRHHPDS